MPGARKAASKRPKTSRGQANANRGEHSLTLGGKTYRLRPSYTAITAIEDELGRSSIELLRAANACALGFAELGTIVAELVKAGAADEFDRHASAERMGELIFEEGMTAAQVVVTVVLASAVSGGRTASGEAKAVATTASKPGSVTAG
jgi:hypothetical protein